MDILILEFWRFCLVLLILLSSYGIGVNIIDIGKFRSSITLSIEKNLISVTLGLGVLSYLTLFYGISGLLKQNIIWFTLIFSVLLSLRYIQPIIYFDNKEFFYNIYTRIKKLDIYSQTLIGFLLLFIIINLIGSLIPPLNIDDVKYHFAVPKRYINDGQINFLPDIDFSNFPFPIEMLWTISIALDSGELAQLLNFSFSLVVLCWIYLIGIKANLNFQQNILALTLFYSISTVGHQARSGSVELGGVLFFLAGFYCFNLFMKRYENKVLILSGLFFGVFSATKFSNPGFVILLTGWFLYYLIKNNKSFIFSINSAILFSSVAFLVASVWYLKSFLFTGNPFYPFLHNYFGGPPINLELLATGGNIFEGSDSSFNHIFRAPKRFFYQLWYILADPQKIRGHVSPLFLGLLPFVITRLYKREKIFKEIILMSLLFYIYWITFYPLLRIGLPMFAILSIPTAFIISDKKIKNGIRNLLYVFLFVFCLVSLFNSISKVLPNLPLIKNKDYNIATITTSTHEFNAKYFSAINFINDKTPKDSKILLWSNNGYYLERDYVYALGFITTMANPKKIYDTAKVIEEIKYYGITHVAMTDNYLRKKLRETILASKKINIIYQDDHMIIASINY
tara:strand:+ start:2052 stop:3923 length:1872 start_codon:yes stop_codon:yes gene_type:complete